MPFRLRYLSHDLELPLGEFIIGRSDECQLSLDDPLGKFVPSFPEPGRSATVRQLLNHTSGIRNMTSLGPRYWAQAGRENEPADLVAIFADQPVNVAVIEVGLGGITDATNVGDGQVFVVTPISLDHTELLGDTTEDIPHENAGNLKPGRVPVSRSRNGSLSEANLALPLPRAVGAMRNR